MELKDWQKQILNKEIMKEDLSDGYVAFLITQLDPGMIGEEDLEAYDTTWEKALSLSAEWVLWDRMYSQAAPYHTNNLSTYDSVLKFIEIYYK